MADHEEQDLRRALARLQRGRGKRYPSRLRQRITAWIQREIADGRGARELARRLGVHRDTLAAWLQDATASGALVPVEVITTPTLAEPAVVGARTVSVVSPSGFRVEGLTLEEAGALLSRLR